MSSRSGGIGKLSLFVNGKEVLEDANPQRAKSVTIDLTQFAEYFLPGENNNLSLRVYNQAGWLSSALELNYQPPATARGTSSGTSPSPFSRPQPTLYAIVVGTADYAGDKLDLKYADLDAAYFSQALQTAAPGVYADECKPDRIGDSNRKHTLNGMHHLAATKGGKFLSFEFRSVNHKYRWCCAMGHEWEAAPVDIQKGTWLSEMRS